MESFTGNKDLRSGYCTYLIDFKNTIPVEIHRNQATLNIQEDCALSFPVDEKTQLFEAMESRIVHSQTVPRNDSMYLTPLAFSDAFLPGNRTGFLKQCEVLVGTSK